VLTIQDDDDYSSAVGGAVETYGLGCGNLPNPGMTFGGLSFYDQTGTQVTPTWSKYYQSSPPDCNGNIAASATSVTLYHPTLYIGGATTNINSPGTYTYTAVYNDGTTATYQWYIYWLVTGVQQTLGTGQSQAVTVTSSDDDFQISVTVTSGTGSRSTFKNICVFGCG